MSRPSVLGAALAACSAVVLAMSPATPTTAGLVGNPLVAPYALARGADDDVFVADPGAQRIFVRRGAEISLVAGSGTADTETGLVPPGYRNGPADRARFDRPSGIVVLADGSLLVADAGNHCLRRIAHGTVTTYAGEARAAGNADGALTTARFEEPVALARDGATVYVADFGNGVRTIEGGLVRTIDIPGVGSDVRAIGASHDSLFVANVRSSFFARLQPGTSHVNNVRVFESVNAGERSAGTASGFYGVDEQTVLYADPVARTVRSFYWQTMQTGFNLLDPETIPVHALPENASGRAHGDAVPGTSRTLHRPTAVVMLSDGSLVVADPAAHALDDFPAPDLRHPVSGDVATLELSPKSYRIALISNSFAYHNVPYAKSIGSSIEAELDARGKAAGLEREPRVLSIRIAPVTSDAEADYIETYLANGNFDLVVWMYNATLPLTEYLHPGEPSLPGTWEAQVAATLQRTSAALRANGTHLVVAYLPQCSALSRIECATALESKKLWVGNADYRTKVDDPLGSLIAGSGLDTIDLRPTFAASEARADRVPLYGTSDGHLSEAGNALVAEAIARALIERRPWAAEASRP